MSYEKVVMHLFFGEFLHCASFVSFEHYCSYLDSCYFNILLLLFTERSRGYGRMLLMPNTTSAKKGDLWYAV